ncbi:PH domain-containing protein [Staphylococcus simulans]|uniref:PH domain-containing protein n=1 Tax=Staphylococcus simulans TaxID=1286 RepID=UPI0027FC561F|nr:PH domain-containing protein [Staphylococcus simulans]MDQ7116356.1 PH domain-containing protein [Staphylococcus simulans]MDQ7139765.1 PH domain-containing protein [Staphylococcus simulans]WML97567.1 PH domain-containing protein [Staphylococcus simulans]WML99239.1 PH domain-containing protein [Staphylococcus simulans]WMM04095.1 PH domain-containing protein [Staphylococcus simulans]
MHRMAQEGKKVLLISGLIQTGLIVLVFSVLITAEYLWLHLLSKDALKWIVIIAIVLVLFVFTWTCLLNPWLKNKQHGYLLETNQILVQEGMIFVSLKYITLFRIQNIDINEGWLMRKWQLATLTLSTAGGDSEILLINKATAQQIMYDIKHIHDKNEMSEEEAGE